MLAVHGQGGGVAQDGLGQRGMARTGLRVHRQGGQEAQGRTRALAAPHHDAPRRLARPGGDGAHPQIAQARRQPRQEVRQPVGAGDHRDRAARPRPAAGRVAACARAAGRPVPALLVLLLSVLAPAPALAFTGLVVGDSISAAYGLAEEDGWVALAEARLREEWPDARLVNASISGDTTGGGLRRLPAALERFEPDLVIIELGGNDGLRGYPPKAMRQNLEEMTRLANEAGAEVLILGMMIPSNYGSAYTRLFGEAFVEAAETTGATLVPFLLEPIAGDRANFQSDGIHPTAEAQPLLVEHVLPTLEELVATVEEGAS